MPLFEVPDQPDLITIMKEKKTKMEKSLDSNPEPRNHGAYWDRVFCFKKYRSASIGDFEHNSRSIIQIDYLVSCLNVIISKIVQIVYPIFSSMSIHIKHSY